jgi:hypothetical protein
VVTWETPRVKMMDDCWVERALETVGQRDAMSAVWMATSRVA